MELTKQEFIDRFTNQEFVSILSTAKTDIEVEAWLFRFNNITDTIDSLDTRTLQGLGLLVTKNIITQSRLEQISGSAWNGWVVGQSVRILPPFDSGYPDVYTIQGFDPDSQAILVADSRFSEQYVEAV
jgi:hypothetical protein